MLNFDKWLSRQLSVPSYHLNENEITSLARKDISSVPIFIDAKVETNDRKKALHLHNLNFKPITTNIRFKKKIFSGKFEKKNCRFAHLKDKIKVKKIAYNSFLKSRFHLDKRLSKNIVDKLKSEWVSNFFHNKRGDWMILFEVNSKVEGFLLLLKEKENNNLIIDLIAVSKKYKRKGIATSLIDFANYHFVKKYKFLIAGTQINNIEGIKFYKKLGFKQFSKQSVFHFYKRRKKTK
jgi:ribosomal protein S18 acetylase RimI-like enzyme